MNIRLNNISKQSNEVYNDGKLFFFSQSAEVFEHAMDYIHEKVEEMNVTSMERGEKPMESLLSPEYLEELEDLSGCHPRVSLVSLIRFISLQQIRPITAS